MTRLTVRNDLPGYNCEAAPGAGHTLIVLLDGVEQDWVETVDDERGFVDVFSNRSLHGFTRHRLFGEVELVWKQRPGLFDDLLSA